MSFLETATNTTFDNTFKELQDEFGKANSDYSKLMEEASVNIHFDSDAADEAKEKLIEFAAEQERIKNYQSLGERFLRRVANVPLLGGLAKDSADGIRTARLSDASVAELVSSMYEGLEHQAKGIVNTEARLLKIYEYAKNNISVMRALSTKIKAVKEDTSTPASHVSMVMKMDITVSLMIEGALDKLATLEITLPATRALLESIYKNMPVSKAELLSNLTMSTGIYQINKLASHIKEMDELSSIVNDGIYEQTQLAMVHLLELNTVSEADIIKLENNAKRREALREKVDIARRNAAKQLQLAYTRTQDLMEKSHKQRIVSSAVSEVDNAVSLS